MDKLSFDILHMCFNNPSSAELSYLIFHPLEDVPRYRDPQLHVVQTKHLQIFMFEHYLKQQFIQNNSVYLKQQWYSLLIQ